MLTFVPCNGAPFLLEVREPLPSTIQIPQYPPSPLSFDVTSIPGKEETKHITFVLREYRSATGRARLHRYEQVTP